MWPTCYVPLSLQVLQSGRSAASGTLSDRRRFSPLYCVHAEVEVGFRHLFLHFGHLELGKRFFVAGKPPIASTEHQRRDLTAGFATAFKILRGEIIISPEGVILSYDAEGVCVIGVLRKRVISNREFPFEFDVFSSGG